MNLEQESKVFEANKAELLDRHEGQYVLIKGADIIGVYGSDQAAYSAGLERFGVAPFLVKHVLHQEPVGFVPMMSFVPRANL